MKVEFEELLHLQKEIDRSTKEMAARLEVVRQKTNAISRLQSFKGKAADSAKHYFHTTHGEMIEALVTAARQVQHRYNQIISEFEGTVDDSPGAVLHADYMHDLNQKTRIVKNQMMDIHHEGAQVLHSISDIVSIPAPDLGHFIESAEASQKFANEVNEKLHAFDRKALQIVEESRRDVDRVMKKVMEAGKRSLVGGESSNLHLQKSETKDGSISKTRLFILLTGAYKTYKDVSKKLKKADKATMNAAKIIVESMLSPQAKRRITRGDISGLTKEQLRKYNNILSFNLFRIKDKAIIDHIRKFKVNSFTRENLEELAASLETFGRERGKLALQKEFTKLYGLEKYEEFNKLNPKKMATKFVKDFNDELVGKKITNVKKTIKFIPEWKNPKLAYKKIVDNFNESTKGLNKIGKTISALDKGLGPLNFSLSVADNYKKYKGDTQKILVGTAVDGVFTAGVTTTSQFIGGALGSALVPPIGTVAGIVVGTMVGYAVNRKFGKPPKSVVDRTKDLLNEGVDEVQSVAKKIVKFF